MKRMSKIKALFLACLLMAALLVCSCGETPDPGPDPEVPVTHTLNVVDYSGAAADIVAVVEFYKGDEVIATKRLSDAGTASFDALPGDYTAVISFPNIEYSYNTEEAIFTKDKTTATVTVYNVPGSPYTVYVPCNEHVDDDENGKCDWCLTVMSDSEFEGRAEYGAKSLGVGATYVTIDRAEMSYFLFTPEMSGIYRFSCISEGASLGYYGGIHYIQSNNLAEMTDGAFEITVPDSGINTGSGGTTQFVLGVSSEALKNAVIVIERIGNYIPEMGYTDIHAPSTLTKYDSLLNNSLVDIDITDPNLTVVFNDADGYYHLGTADGSVVLIKISAAGNSHLPNLMLPSFVTICETDRMVYYVYDDNGTLIRKESYNSLIEEYAAACGSMGVVPLDKTIADAIKNTGNHRDWWSGMIFGEGAGNISRENAWLFACCYEEEDTYGSASAPISVTPLSETDSQDLAFLVTEGTPVSIFVSTTKGTLTFTAAEGVTVTVDGTDYTADQGGKITVVVNPNTAVTVTYSSDTADSKVVHFTCVTYSAS